MSNVVSLRAERYARTSSGPPPPAVEEADLTQLRARILGLQSKAKEEILRSILLLDIAAQHGRQIARRTDDAAAKSSLGAQISFIEQLLQNAREMALKL